MLIGLLKARAGFGPVMTFLFTSPLLNPIVIVLFIPVLGVQVTIIYALLALSISILAGILLQYFNFDRFIKQELIGVTSCCDTNSTNDTNTSCCSTEQPQVKSCCASKKPSEPSQYQLAWVES